MANNENKELKDPFLLHVAGATVKHESKFAHLKVLVNDAPLSNEFCQKYVVPFYLESTFSSEYRNAYLNIREDVDSLLISKLLGDFDWRPRSVGAHFAALENISELEINIGNLLLRSEVCFAGYNYCLVLASFSSPLSVDFLNQYLSYYLSKPELDFDQAAAMSALFYIDKIFQKDLLSPHMKAWHDFAKGKTGLVLDESIEIFNEEMNNINTFKQKFNVT